MLVVGILAALFREVQPQLVDNLGALPDPLPKTWGAYRGVNVLAERAGKGTLRHLGGNAAAPAALDVARRRKFRGQRYRRIRSPRS